MREPTTPADRDWLDDLVGHGAVERAPSRTDDHRAGMEAIAAQLARMEGPAGREPASRDGAVALREAIAQIARRQAALDDQSGMDGDTPADHAASAEARDAVREAPIPDPDRSVAEPPRAGRDTSGATPWRSPEPAVRAIGDPSGRATVGSDASAATRGVPVPAWTPERSGLRRAGIDLSAEVSQTFARFSRDLLDAIQATDARPAIEALDLRVRHIGQAVEGIEAGVAGSAMGPRRDGSGTRPTAPAPEVVGALKEMRGLLDGFRPGAAMASLESRLDDLASRMERGLDHGDPTVLIERLSHRVDEIHSSLRSQLAQSAIDTKPLETLVRGIADRIGEARDASTEFGRLESAVQDAAAGTDVRGAQALEGLIAKIGERLDRSDASLRSLDGVEQSLGNLFSQFEVTRQVAIDAAETAARTAARDTLRAAMQNPALAQRPAEASPALADQVARGIDDLRAMQEIAQRRTQDALSQIQDAMERLTRHMAANDGVRGAPSLGRDVRRPDAERGRAGAAPVDADTPLEPGFGRAGAARTEPRFEPDQAHETAPPPDAPVPTGPTADGPASFIAAARRAAQVAQASVASAATQKASERQTRPARSQAAPSGPGPVARAKTVLAQRRRPLLLGLAALVMLVGALEVMNLGIGAPSRGTTTATDTTQRERPQARVADVSASAPIPAPVAEPAAPPVAASAPSPAAIPSPPLPTFVAGPARASGAPVGGIADGLRNLATSGDAAAQYEVGLRYAEGRGVSRDAKEGVGWFQKAAAQGLAPAEYRLGSAYEKGVGVDRDPALAMAWYGKAAAAGNIKAMHNMAVMAAEGAAGKPDYAKAAQWFQKASAFGVRDSQFNLAILYARGLGIEQSLPKSYTWFAIAAAEGDDDAAKKRDEVGQKLDPSALAAAKAAADAYKPETAPAAANDVPPPPGGWDAVAPRPSSALAPAKVSRL